MGGHFLLQGIFPTQGSNLGLLCCKQIIYCLRYQGSPYMFVFFKYNLSFYSVHDHCLINT